MYFTKFKIIPERFLLNVISISFFAIININAQKAVYTSDLDSIVVKVGRHSSGISSMPFSVNVVDTNSLILINNVMSVKEIFNTTPGILVSNRYNPSQDDKIIMRGIGSRASFGTRGIKILLDDIPLTFPDGQSQLNNLDPGSIRSIEILRGPSSALYGNASGGVISVSSNVLNTGKLKIQSTLNGGSFGFIKYGLGVSGKLLKGGAGFNLYTAKSDGFRNHSEAQYSGINFITSQQLNSVLNVTALANYYNAPYLLNPGSLNKFDSDNEPDKARSIILSSGSGKKAEQFQTGISLLFSFSNVFEIRTTFYGISRSLLNSITSRIIELDRFSYGFRSTLFYVPYILDESINITAGIDYEAQDDSRTEYVNEGIKEYESVNAEDIFDNLTYGNKLLSQNETVKNIGFFSQVEYLPFSGLKLSAGIRYDNFIFEAIDRFLNDNIDDSGSRAMQKISPAFGISYRISSNLTAFANYSTAFQTPTTNELSNNTDGSGGFNQSLNPETVHSIETGIRGNINELSFSYDITAYRMFIYDMILPYENRLEETYYSNSGRTASDGLEISLSWQKHKLAQINFAYTYQNMKFEDFKVESGNGLIQLAGNNVPGIPNHSYNLRIISELSFGLSSLININHTGQIYANDLNGPPDGNIQTKSSFINNSYTIIGLQLAYKFRLYGIHFYCSTGIDNLFNTIYSGSVVPNAFGNNFYEPSPGRAYYGSIKVSL